MTTATTDQFALAVLLELRREYAHTQRKLVMWIAALGELQSNLADEMSRGKKRPSADQLLAVRERVYILRFEIAQLQRDVDLALKECRRLDIAIPDDLSGVYVERTNVKLKS